MVEPTYHITTNTANGNFVLLCRHAKPPYHVVERVEFSSKQKLKEVAETLNELVEVMDSLAAMGLSAEKDCST